MLLRLSAIALLTIFSLTSFAKKKIDYKKYFQIGIVGVSGAAIYKKPNFDSPILGYYKENEKIIISKKIYTGPGGFGTFYLTKLKGRKGFGYVVDTEIIPKYKRGESASSNPVYEQMESVRDIPNQVPIYETRYWGLAAGIIDYSEEIEGKKFNDPTNFFGFKFSGPGTLFEGPPLDVEFLFTIKPPAYFSDLSSSASGNIFKGHFNLTLPIFQNMNNFAFYSFGPSWSYTRLSLKIGSQPEIDYQEVRIGANFSLGYAHRWGDYSLRVEGRQYWMVENYASLMLSIQKEY